MRQIFLSLNRGFSLFKPGFFFFFSARLLLVRDFCSRLVVGCGGEAKVKGDGSRFGSSV